LIHFINVNKGERLGYVWGGMYSLDYGNMVILRPYNNFL